MKTVYSIYIVNRVTPNLPFVFFYSLFNLKASLYIVYGKTVQNNVILIPVCSLKQRDLSTNYISD